MVYRGKPSAGCENCRKAKKRCGLEQPTCSRCVKLKKPCSGYRDTTSLQIQDESESVKLKVDRQKVRNSAPKTQLSTPDGSSHGEDDVVIRAPSAASTPHSDSSSSSDDTIEVPPGIGALLLTLNGHSFSTPEFDREQPILPRALKPSADEVASTYFFKQFTASNGHWHFLRDFSRQLQMDPLLDMVIRACGIAAMDNVEGLVMGRNYSRALYAEALSRLNTALRDSKRCKTDECLIAVSMLGYYENLTCDSRESVQSWKAHINGSTQLLKLRGKSQFKTPIGRMLFRETRANILIHCMWDDLEPPAFLWDWEKELERMTPTAEIIHPADGLTKICFRFASLKNRMRLSQLSDSEALEKATEVEMEFVQWSINTIDQDKMWHYHDVEVPDSPHVWNGVVHSYTCHPCASFWNTYRSMRILLTRTQELLVRRFQLDQEQEAAQINYFRSVRRQMADEICASVPTQLGHASPAFNSPCILITAYGSIWPLFFAGTCALERLGLGGAFQNPSSEWQSATSAAAAQASWIIGRMEYISKHVGLRWADGIAATLKGDYKMHQNLHEDDWGVNTFIKVFWKERYQCEMSQMEERKAQTPDWLREVEESGRGPRVLIENPIDEMLNRKRDDWGPLWLGRTEETNMRQMEESQRGLL
ncbi:hypothetical protein AC579_3049 [Lecanosticta acicola]|uniref:Zn(2)-C6 fungal-type domain-containing protein n=1 Tax=Lecanosticta acicola TaxID=111012 RepID=A0AAI8Z6F1_9PEZI|nr:hypothetical protein AC579_3049 [Lecanosticta acicola]